jgi:hypothetical protein
VFLLPVVFAAKLKLPTAVLPTPIVFALKAQSPTATLFVPVVFNPNVLYPKAVLADASLFHKLQYPTAVF